MNIRSGIICILCVATLILSCGVAAAASITDGTNDVWHWTLVGTTWSWVGNVADKPNIDITQISSEVGANQVTLTLKVKGTIQSSENVFYYIYYNTTDTSYSVVWSKGHGTGWAVKNSSYEPAENITASQGTVSARFVLLGNPSQKDLWAYTAQYTSLENQTMQEWWGDWAPDSRFVGHAPGGGNTTHNQTGDGNTTTHDNETHQPGKTPGFEAVATIIALCILMVLLRRKR